MVIESRGTLDANAVSSCSVGIEDGGVVGAEDIGIPMRVCQVLRQSSGLVDIISRNAKINIKDCIPCRDIELTLVREWDPQWPHARTR